MGKMQRTKGATYEREIAKLLSDKLGRPTKRMLGQARDGGHDLEQIGPFLFECKRRKGIAVYEWLEQIKKATTDPEQIPVVIARADHKDSIVVLDLLDFLHLAKTLLELERALGEATTL